MMIATTTLVLLLQAATTPAKKEPSLFDKPEFTESKFEAAVDSGAHASANAMAKSAVPPLELLRLPPGGRASRSANGAARDAHARAVKQESERQVVEAAASFGEAVRLDPSARHIVDAAVHLLAHGAPARAAAMLGEGARRYPGDVDIRLALGLAQFASAEYEQAKASFARALPDGRAADALAIVAETAPGLAGAIAAMLDGWPLQQAVALVRDSGAGERERRMAEGLFRKAIAGGNGIDRAHFELAKVYLLDQKSSAVVERELEAALRANPRHELAHFRLAQLLQKSGNKARADEHFTTYRALHSERLAKEEAERTSRVLLSEKPR